jgi:LPXTG-site transpeptidase (sortase) family protein
MKTLSKIFLRRKLFVVILVGIIVIPGIVFLFIQKSQEERRLETLYANVNTIDLNKSEETGVGLPVRLLIPEINVDSVIENVGLTSEGRVGVPVGPEGAAWFELGPRPGEKGSAIIDGHSGWRNGIPAVFDNLHKLDKGDKIHIEDDKGEIITFVVREFRTYGPKEDAPDVFGSSDGGAHLNLITCTGVWNNIDKTHSDRLVVFTDRE